MDNLTRLARFYRLPTHKGQFLGSRETAKSYDKFADRFATKLGRGKFRVTVKPGMEIVFQDFSKKKKEGRWVDDIGFDASNVLIGPRRRED